jgi:protein-S-isoprenylcysteine O-methyltransferase Ste14
MIEENIWDHFGNWWGVAIWIVLYGIFFAFLPFYKRSRRRPASVYLAFVVAFALEMFGVPFSMYAIAGVLGRMLPEGVLWGHTLSDVIGLWGMYVGLIVSLIGVLLVVLGWKEIYRHYWRQETGEGRLVTGGIYRHIRHPQYTGFFLITFGILCEWATLPLLVMWPTLLVVYYRLARKEERDMEQEFGAAYRRYKARTGMFLPSLAQRPAVAEEAL